MTKEMTKAEMARKIEELEEQVEYLENMNFRESHLELLAPARELIKNAMREHPAICDVYLKDEKPKSLLHLSSFSCDVILHDGMHVTADEIREFCEKRFPKHWRIFENDRLRSIGVRYSA